MKTTRGHGAASDFLAEGRWGVLELDGRRFAGFATIEIFAGVQMVRMDMTAADETITQLFSPVAILSFSPTTQETVVAIGKRFSPRPVHEFELLRFKSLEEDEELRP